MIGVTTAYELAVDGHEVTVFERRGTVAAGTSFANAGLVAPGYVTPWAAPGMPGEGRAPSLRRARAGANRRPARRRDARLGVALVARLPARRSTAPIGLACTASPTSAASGCCSSTQRLHLDFERAQGFLVLLRSARELALAEAGVRALAELGVAPGGPRRRRLPRDRAGPEPGDAAPRRHLLEGRRGRQLPRVHAPAAQGGRARRRALPLQRPRRADSCRQASPAARPAGSRTTRATRRCARATQRVADDATAGRRDHRAELRRVVVCAAVDSRPSAAAARRAPAAHRRPRLLGHRAAAPRRRSTSTSSRARR